MQITTLPALIITQFALILIFSWRARKQGFIEPRGLLYIVIGLALLSIWAVTVTWFAKSGTFATDSFLASWPALWLTGIAVLIVEIPMVFSKKVKETINKIIDATPLHWLVAFHGFRILAIGSILKAHSGEFAWYFGMFIGIPDFIFGVTAIILLPLVYAGKISEKFIAIWNYLGALIIVPTALILMQLGLPGPLQQFTATPTIATIFEFPMVLAPTVCVPVFAMANLFVARRLLQRHKLKKQETYAAQTA